MDKETFEYLETFEKKFNTAINSGYAKGVTSNDKIRLKEILKKTTGEDFPLSFNCSMCTLKLLRKVGQLYFKEKENKENKETVELEPTLIINELEEAATNTEQNNGKSGRKGKKKRKE